MTDNKLTLEGIAKIKSAADGNGIDPSKVELLGSEEVTLTVHAQMNLKLEMVRENATYPGGFKNTKSLPKDRAEKIAGEKDVEQKITELKTSVETGGLWSRDAARQLLAEPGQAWGLEKADVIIDSMAKAFYCDTPCTACNGASLIGCSTCHQTGLVSCFRCHETGLENCTSCNGTGLNNADPEQYCSYCNGSRQVYCRDCRGQRQVQCVQCRGQGRVKCNMCNGNGSFTTEINILPTAKAEFLITDSANLPGGFRKAIARAGTKTLAKGHATISAKELDTSNAAAPFIPYTAVMPYAETRLRINGKPMKCALLGHKCVILDLPAFIDTAIEPKIAQFEQAAKQPDTLAKALEIRVCREAFGLLQLKHVEAKMLRQLYPAGLSLEMAGRVLNVMRKLVHSQTILARIIVAVISVVMFVAADYFIITSGIRATIATLAKPISAFLFDVAICTGGYFLQHMLLRFAAAKRLQQKLGASEKIISQSAGGVGIIAGVLVAVLYVVMLFVLKSMPGWQLIFTRPFG
ncbi:MAG: hypothetical protein SFW65_01015 [Alphaproteobacteria bacterium]|nr:hypothetical protein [Alphaproteobacteria bacterium]